MPDAASMCQRLFSWREAGDWDCSSSFPSAHLVALDIVFGCGETQFTHLWKGTIVPIMRVRRGNGMKMSK